MAISCRKLAGWYLRLAAALEAGLPLVGTLERVKGIDARRRREMAEALREGKELEEVLAGTDWIPPMDRPALSAGARSGRLPETLRALSRKHEMLARQGRRIKGAMIYPLLVLHFGVLILPIPDLILGDAGGYLAQVATYLVPLWVVLGLGMLAFRHPRIREVVMRCLPLWRKFSRNQALADLCFTLEAELTAGEGAAAAWRDAGQVVESPALAKAARRVAKVMEIEGRSPGELLDGLKVFPDDFVHFYQSGEEAGRLTENLSFLSNSFRENADGALLAAAIVYSKMVLIGVAVWVGYQVISFYAGYFEQIDQMLP